LTNRKDACILKIKSLLHWDGFEFLIRPAGSFGCGEGKRARIKADRVIPVAEPGRGDSEKYTANFQGKVMRLNDELMIRDIAAIGNREGALVPRTERPAPLGGR
jgi:hypothetical protein